MAGTYPNDRSTLEPAFATLQAAVAERHPGFQLALGAEYFLDASLDQIARGGDLLAPETACCSSWPSAPRPMMGSCTNSF